MTVKVHFVGSGDAFGSGGRFQTCILVDAPGRRFAIDFGTSSLIAMNQLGIEHNSIDAVLLTHLHGDHCGGIPFMLMDAMLAAKRNRPLTIAGPKDTEFRMHQICEALFPGMHVMTPRFPLEYIELEVGKANNVMDLVVTPQRARHTAQTNPTALRIEVDGKVVSYTGDGEFSEEMAQIGKDADLLILESYMYDKPVRSHLNYYTVEEKKEEFGAKRIMLTHMHAQMLARKDDVPEETAYDGLVVEI